MSSTPASLTSPATPAPPPDRWLDWLRARGRIASDGAIRDFGDQAAERLAARDGAVVCDLSSIALLSFRGPDAVAFLQGQLSSDVAAIPVGGSALAAYCTPQGRVLATVALWRAEPERIVAALPQSNAEPFRARIARFVLRAKVRIEWATDEWVRIGVGGPRANAALDAAATAREVAAGTISLEAGGAVAPDAVGAAGKDPSRIAADCGARVPLPGNRWLLLAPPAVAPRTWEALAAHARPAGEHAWRWLEVASGAPLIGPESAEQFVPQALNWDLVDGVSFRKGCYPGQEIVARMRYLGKLKERLFRLAPADAGQGPAGDTIGTRAGTVGAAGETAVAADDARGHAALPGPGTRIVSPLFGGQSAGRVVSSAIAPGGGVELLAVVQLAAVADGRLHLVDATGPALTVLPLPYPIPDAG